MADTDEMVVEVIKEDRSWEPTGDFHDPKGTPASDEDYDTPDPVWPGMPRSSFKIFGAYLREIADKLGLRDWAFNLKWEYCKEENAFASVTVIEGQKKANVWLSKEFDSSPREEQKKAIIHELIHCHLDALDKVLWTAEPLIGRPAFQILERNHDNAIETATDALACELACLLPDIPEG